MAAASKTKGGDKTVDKGASGDDQSMEEILQSIRKIISEENDDPDTVASFDILPADEEENDGDEASDILELTDALLDDGSVVNMEAEEDDVVPAPVDEEPEPDFTPEPEPEPEPVRPAPHRPVSHEDEGLMSSVSVAAAAEAMRGLRQSASAEGLGELRFTAGDGTVEGLVAQLLRPLLKEWLDANLPEIVRQEVQREVRRVSSTLK